MRSKNLFLYWTLFVCLVTIACVIGALLGWTDYVLVGDPTHITLITIGVFTATTLWLGNLCWKMANSENASRVVHALETGWFASSACVTLGLIGTVIGYLLMMRGVPDAGADVAEQLVRQIRMGMGTVLINTVVGGVCGLLIEVQSHFIGQIAKQVILEEES